MGTTLDDKISEAVKWYWSTLSDQAEAQQNSGDALRGRRSDVVGGKQMGKFAYLIESKLVEADIPTNEIKHDHDAVLPGYHRATKRWDIAIIHDEEVHAVIELKSLGSSHGNNLNNRIEEAIGNSVDLRKACTEGVFNQSEPPWIGYLLLMADTEDVGGAVRVREKNFPVDAEFADASYLDRAVVFCERMSKQGIIDSAAFIASDEVAGENGAYREPNSELSIEQFLRDLVDSLKNQR